MTSKLGYLAFALFALTVPAANWLIANVGTCMPNGPCLIPVGFGLMAPSGVLMIGAALVLRELASGRLARFLGDSDKVVRTTAIGAIYDTRVNADKVLAEAVAKDPLTKKVHDSYMAFKTKYDRWSEVSEEAYHIKVRG